MNTKRTTAGLIVFLTIFLCTTFALAGAIQLPQTGQTKCYDTNGYQISCAGTGQDGEVRAGVAWPNPHFHDNGNGTITDNLTGLMWTKNANLSGSTVSWYQAIYYCNNLTQGGYSDWRLPNVNELESLINDDEANSATWLNNLGFTNVQSFYYWSSTTYAVTPGYAWVVFMYGGFVSYDYKSGGYGGYAWPVRAGQ